jgi:ribosome-associated protein
VVPTSPTSQLANRKAAATKLAVLLDAAMSAGPPKRRPTRPTKGSVERRLDTKRRHGQLKRQRRERDD